MFPISSLLHSSSAASVQFMPTPFQDKVKGRNSHAYLPSVMTLTNLERELFINEIAQYAIDANKKWGIPASAIIGIAVVESGYGTTRIAHYANNLFGIKAWGNQPANAWQLEGQPDEDFVNPIPVLANYGEDRKVFDESQRRDNWYRMFNNYSEAVDYLAGTLLQNKRYGFARLDYEKRLQQNMSIDEASKRFLYDIAQAGYNHLGGDYYRQRVGSIMDHWDLYQYDAMDQAFSDIREHWAASSIEDLSEQGIISGFPNRTFRPDEPITKEQFVKMLVVAKGDALVYSKTTFSDVLKTNWSHPYIESAIQNHIIVEINEHSLFSPNQALTRQEMGEYTARALRLEPLTISLTYKDKHLIDNQTGLIGAVVHHGLIKGYEDQTFRPLEPLTRAQAATMIQRILAYQSHP